MSDSLTPTQEVNACFQTGEISLAGAALAYARIGWCVFPLKPLDKSPLIKGGFHKATNDLDSISAWWQQYPQANIGLSPRASGLIVFDIDSEAAEKVARALGLLEVETLTARTGRADYPGTHLYFQHPGGERIGNLRLGLEGTCLFGVDGKTPGLEVKADAGYVVAPPSIHPSGSRYAFIQPAIEPASLPQAAMEAIRALAQQGAVGIGASPDHTGEVSNAGSEREPVALTSDPSPREPSVGVRDAERWLNALAPERCDNYQDWVNVLMALHHQFAGSPDEPEVLALATHWSQQSGKYQDGDVEDKWQSFGVTGTGSQITIRSLRHWAHQDSSRRDGYPVIDCTEASAIRLTRPTWRAIHTRNAPAPITFLSNGALAGLRPRPDDTLYPSPFTCDTLGQHLADNISDFQRRTRNGIVQCYPPLSLIKQLLANPQPPIDLPTLRRVVPVPIFAQNGELIITPGYHPASHTYYAPLAWMGSLRSVPARPTLEQVKEAIRIFDEHIGTNFPFDEDSGASRAHALALCLQGFVTDVIGQMTPLFDIEAAQRRTGKGLLTECCLMPAFGPTLAAKRTPLPKTDEEMIKVLTALFREGGPLIAFDNVKGTVDLPSFEAALTAEYFEGRLLGSSSLVQACNRATWVMISNNPEMSGDLAGRAIRIRLISPVEFPEDRTDFERLQPNYTREHLPELIWAMHTLVRNWFAVGCPGPGARTPGFGSYPRWRHVLGGIINAAGVKGFLLNREKLRREVTRADMQWREFIQSWRNRFGTNPIPTSDLLVLAGEYDIPLSGENERGKATALGMRLGKCTGIRYFDQYTIEKRKKGGERLWELVDHGVGDFGVPLESSALDE